MSTVLAPWLVRAKASPPRSPAGAVARQRLLTKLTHAANPTVVALQAPAGFGKTMLLSPTFHGVSIASWVGRLLRTIEDSHRPHVLIVDDLERLPGESARKGFPPIQGAGCSL